MRDEAMLAMIRAAFPVSHNVANDSQEIIDNIINLSKMDKEYISSHYGTIENLSLLHPADLFNNMYQLISCSFEYHMHVLLHDLLMIHLTNDRNYNWCLSQQQLVAIYLLFEYVKITRPMLIAEMGITHEEYEVAQTTWRSSYMLSSSTKTSQW